MNTQEYEFMAIARAFDKKGSFDFIKKYYYKNGKKLRVRPRYQEVLIMDSVDPSFIQFIADVFPKKVRKTATGFRVKYFSREAVNICKVILPYLKVRKREAEILIEFSILKSTNTRNGVPKETYNRRRLLARELRKLNLADRKSKDK